MEKTPQIYLFYEVNIISLNALTAFLVMADNRTDSEIIIELLIICGIYHRPNLFMYYNIIIVMRSVTPA